MTVKGREMYLVIDGNRYDYNGVHDWELFSRWFFDSLLDYEAKQRGEPLEKCPNCGGRHFIDKSDSGLLKENESKCLKCGAKYIDL